MLENLGFYVRNNNSDHGDSTYEKIVQARKEKIIEQARKEGRIRAFVKYDEAYEKN